MENTVQMQTTYDFSNHTILLVEDDFISVRLINEILKKTGAHLLVAGSADEAIDSIKSNDHIDLILMDLKLPGKGGDEAIKEIREFSQVPIIAQTGFSAEDEKLKSIFHLCSDYIAKPIKKQVLFSKIHNIVA